MDFTIGADPEVFVCDDKDNLKSIVGKIGGSKQHPLALPIGDGFAVQEDNVALEFNIPASKNKAEFVSNISKITQFLEETVGSMYKYKFSRQSAAIFPKAELLTPESKIFGCDPDYNAWTGKRNPKPKAADKNLRSAGGHIHVGINGLDIRRSVRNMDLTALIPSLLMDELGEKRRELYGKEGAYRTKPFGFEYRSLSNFWIFKPEFTEWAYDATAKALELSEKGFDAFDEKEAIFDAVQNNNKEAALQLVNKYNLQVL